jgi:hypothetical protein
VNIQSRSNRSKSIRVWALTRPFIGQSLHTHTFRQWKTRRKAADGIGALLHITVRDSSLGSFRTKIFYKLWKVFGQTFHIIHFFLKRHVNINFYNESSLEWSLTDRRLDDEYPALAGPNNNSRQNVGPHIDLPFFPTLSKSCTVSCKTK